MHIRVRIAKQPPAWAACAAGFPSLAAAQRRHRAQACNGFFARSSRAAQQIRMDIRPRRKAGMQLSDMRGLSFKIVKRKHITPSGTG
jgi:hypothetical protein